MLNCVLVPGIGFLLVHIFPLTPDASVGILLLAAIPGTPIALQFTRMAKTRLAFAAAMTFVLSLVSIAMTPLAIQVMPQTVQRNQRPMLDLIVSIVLYIGLPLCAGLWLARRAPKIAPRLVLPLGVLATVVFVFLMWETRLVRREAIHAISGRGTILAMLLLLLLSMLIGWMSGGPDLESRRVLATSTGMRSVIVVLYIARYCFPGTAVYMVPMCIYHLWCPRTCCSISPLRDGTSGDRRRDRRVALSRATNPANLFQQTGTTSGKEFSIVGEKSPLRSLTRSPA